MIAMKQYIGGIKNTNTKLAVNVVYEKLQGFSRQKGKDIDRLTNKDIEEFIIDNYNGKSETTIANTITSIKKLFEQIGKRDELKDITFLTMREKISAKPIRIFTPAEMKDFVDSLINYQDKALVLLVYLGLYDKDFETIRHLKECEIFEDCIIAKNQEFKINKYIYDILAKAKTEMEYKKYDGDSYYIRDRNGYFMRGQIAPRTTKDYISSITLKKRFETFKRYLDEDDFNPVTIKNSKLVYDMIKLEYEYNAGFDINQLLLIDYAKDNDKKGCIEKLNIAKKNIKDKILTEIIKKEDVICP